jgi:hypothetical protein
VNEQQCRILKLHGTAVLGVVCDSSVPAEINSRWSDSFKSGRIHCHVDCTHQLSVNRIGERGASNSRIWGTCPSPLQLPSNRVLVNTWMRECVHRHAIRIMMAELRTTQVLLCLPCNCDCFGGKWGAVHC